MRDANIATIVALRAGLVTSAMICYESDVPCGYAAMEKMTPERSRGGRTVIRRAVTADLQAVGRLGAMLLRAHHGFDADRFMSAGPGAEGGYASFLSTQLDAHDAVVLVADRDGQIVGYAYAGIEPRSWKELRERAGFIHDVLVDEGSRGAGIADMLMDAAITWVREQGVPRVLLWTAARNGQAQRLFVRKGFRSTMIEMTLELTEDPDAPTD
jgi:GNAT superfamily N-acetyltransferase